MSTNTITPSIPRQAAIPVASPQTAHLLGGGVLAGAMFLVLWALQAFTRDGFDPGHHPISLLSLGDLGWIQIANFVLTGALVIACAVGLRRGMRPGRGDTWGPRLIGGMGAGLVLAGVFVTDPGAGFPAGAPAGTPDMSWHGGLHEAGYVLVMLSWTAACLVFRAHFATYGQRGWARACIATLVAVFLVSGLPDPDSLPTRIVLATAMQFGLLAAVATRIKRRLPNVNSGFDTQ